MLFNKDDVKRLHQIIDQYLIVVHQKVYFLIPRLDTFKLVDQAAELLPSELTLNNF